MANDLHEPGDTTTPSSARIWNHWLGGTDNYPVDREAGDRFSAVYPGIVDVARASRGFLARAVRFLAAEGGIRQFLDVGSGLPAADNTHEVARRAAPESRVVYVDNDPLVVAHARGRLADGDTFAFLDLDLRGPEAIRNAAARTLDFGRPVALLLLGVLGHLTDAEAAPTLRRLLDALPSGSHLVLADGTDTSAARVEAHRRYNADSPAPYHLRSPAQIADFFAGLELLAPGVVSTSRWRPEPGSGTPPEVDQYCGVARKP